MNDPKRDPVLEAEFERHYAAQLERQGVRLLVDRITAAGFGTDLDVLLRAFFAEGAVISSRTMADRLKGSQ